jgi:hypothetical protein
LVRSFRAEWKVPSVPYGVAITHGTLGSVLLWGMR